MFMGVLDQMIPSLVYVVLICTQILPMNFQSICFMREKNFIDLCTEISKLPSYSITEYSMKPEAKSEEGLFEVYLYKYENTTDTLTKRVEARGCSFTPRLFLSDNASKKYSLLVYRPVANGLEQIDQIDNLVTLGYLEPDPDHPSELKHWETLTMMSSKVFVRLCKEVLKLPKFRNHYSLMNLPTPAPVPVFSDLKEYEVFHFGEDRRPFVDRVMARGPCPTIPRLYLSDGLKKFSAFLYHYLDAKKLVRVSIAKNLPTLGYDEHLEGAPSLIRDQHLQSIYLMSVSKFSLLCEEIVQSPAFSGSYLEDLSVPESKVDTYDVYLPPDGHVHARKCPIEPELVISDGPTKELFSVYITGGTGIVRTDQLKRVMSTMISTSPVISDLLSMPEIEFRNLCEKICHLFPFSSAFNIRPNDSSRISRNRKIYLPGESVAFGYVTVRVCPTAPKELFLSDGPTEGSIWTYCIGSKGFTRMYTLENLSDLKQEEISTSSDKIVPSQ